MDVADELLANNRLYADRLLERHVDLEPARALAIVTCMDSRLNVFDALGLEEGDAHVLRNAGGVITDDMIRSLAISQRLLGTREIMLIHHTDCGMQRLTDDGFRAELQADTGEAPSFAIESFTDLDGAVRQSILRVQRSVFGVPAAPRQRARVRLRRRHAPPARGDLGERRHELVDPGRDFVPDPANLRQRLPRRVLDLPTHVALAGDDGARVIARRDDHVRPADALVVELRRHVV